MTRDSTKSVSCNNCSSKPGAQNAPRHTNSANEINTPKRKIYDMLIVGSGAAGSFVAKELTAAGANVLLLGSRYEHPFCR